MSCNAKESNSKQEIDKFISGSIEPHNDLLSVPPKPQSLYKIMTIENLLRSISGNYLHFNRVDNYKDFSNADPHDGQQLPKDESGNTRLEFEKAPNFTISDYYNQSRARTYACCFSLENSGFIWKKYGNGGEKGKVCAVFIFGKLRERLNKTLQPGNAVLACNDIRCQQIFSLNYGKIIYVDWETYQINQKTPPNPIEYTYIKDKKYSEEKEFRIALSALGLGQFGLRDGSKIGLSNSLSLFFDFRAAFADKTIQQIILAPDSDSDYLRAELHKLRIYQVTC